MSTFDAKKALREILTTDKIRTNQLFSKQGKEIIELYDTLASYESWNPDEIAYLEGQLKSLDAHTAKIFTVLYDDLKSVEIKKVILKNVLAGISSLDTADCSDIILFASRNLDDQEKHFEISSESLRSIARKVSNTSGDNIFYIKLRVSEILNIAERNINQIDPTLCEALKKIYSLDIEEWDKLKIYNILKSKNLLTDIIKKEAEAILKGRQNKRSMKQKKEKRSMLMIGLAMFSLKSFFFIVVYYAVLLYLFFEIRPLNTTEELKLVLTSWSLFISGYFFLAFISVRFIFKETEEIAQKLLIIWGGVLMISLPFILARYNASKDWSICKGQVLINELNTATFTLNYSTVDYICDTGVRTYELSELRDISYLKNKNIAGKPASVELHTSTFFKFRRSFRINVEEN